MSLTVAIQTVPERAAESLQRTLHSVVASGLWGEAENRRIYVDEKHAGPNRSYLRMCQGAINDWGLKDGWVLTLQDDITLTEGLSSILWSDLPSGGVLSLFTPRHAYEQRRTAGWQRIAKMRGSYGAQALLWPGELLRRYIEDSPHPDRPSGADHEILIWCRDRGIPWFYHNPSFCFHDGADHKDSTLDVPAGNVSGRQCAEFLERVE